MKELLNIKNVERDRDLQGLRESHDDIESYVVRNVRSLYVDDDNYGSLLTPIKKLETWDLIELLCLIQDKLKGRENCLTPDISFPRKLQDRYKVGKILHVQVQVYRFLNKLRKSFVLFVKINRRQISAKL